MQAFVGTLVDVRCEGAVQRRLGGRIGDMIREQGVEFGVVVNGASEADHIACPDFR